MVNMMYSLDIPYIFVQFIEQDEVIEKSFATYDSFLKWYLTQQKTALLHGASFKIKTIRVNLDFSEEDEWAHLDRIGAAINIDTLCLTCTNLCKKSYSFHTWAKIQKSTILQEVCPAYTP